MQAGHWKGTAVAESLPCYLAHLKPNSGCTLEVAATTCNHNSFVGNFGRHAFIINRDGGRKDAIIGQSLAEYC